ncbi:MAG: rhomboid family intramembrane serine protease [Arenimonas sp.]
MIWFLPTSEQEATRHTPWVTWTLVVVNVIAFAAMMLGPETTDQWWATYALTPAHAQWWQYLTSNFVHADPLHLIGNMVFLIIFGDNVEDVLGPLGFALLYFLGGLAGDVTFVANNPDMLIPSAGASGCIATITGAYAVMFFNRAVDLQVFFLVFPIFSIAVPALLLMLFYFGFDVWLTGSGGGKLGGAGVNYVAHGVGFMIGVLAGLLALGSGAVARFRKHREGHALFGYLPWNLGPRSRWR